MSPVVLCTPPSAAGSLVSRSASRTPSVASAVDGGAPPTRAVWAVIPAHDEATEIGPTLVALSAQVPAHRTVVVCDNCTDGTEDIARRHGALVMTTVDNRDKKAGALNQAMDRLLPVLTEDDRVLVLDADTRLGPEFVMTAQADLSAEPRRGAVGGIFYGNEPHGLLQRCQANEYARYARQIDRERRVMVLSGTAALIRVAALRELAERRGHWLPGTTGDVYDRTALTEDMELTLALLSTGWSLSSPAPCTTRTQLMPTVRALHQQRLRWYRGALENLSQYGWTPVTRRYFGQQLMLLLGCLALLLYVVVMVADVTLGQLSFNPWWTLVGVLFAVERVTTAWRAGPRGRLIAAVLVIELGYDLMLQAAFLRALAQKARRADQHWHHNT